MYRVTTNENHKHIVPSSISIIGRHAYQYYEHVCIFSLETNVRNFAFTNIRVSHHHSSAFHELFMFNGFSGSMFRRRHTFAQTGLNMGIPNWFRIEFPQIFMSRSGWNCVNKMQSKHVAWHYIVVNDMSYTLVNNTLFVKYAKSMNASVEMLAGCLVGSASDSSARCYSPVHLYILNCKYS